MELIHLQADHPLRPVDWRWRRAEAARRLAPRGARLSLDHFADIARDFQDEHAACQDEFDRAQLQQEYPDLFAARELRLADEADPGQRYEVEARLLAGDTDKHIAQRAGTRVDVVLWFEALFFS